jgi:dihydrofolate reductase
MRNRESLRVSNDDPRDVVAELEKKPGRDIWLFGGGMLFRSLLDAGLGDTVEVAVMRIRRATFGPIEAPHSAGWRVALTF